MAQITLPSNENTFTMAADCVTINQIRNGVAQTVEDYLHCHLFSNRHPGKHSAEAVLEPHHAVADTCLTRLTCYPHMDLRVIISRGEAQQHYNDDCNVTGHQNIRPISLFPTQMGLDAALCTERYLLPTRKAPARKF